MKRITILLIAFFIVLGFDYMLPKLITLTSEDDYLMGFKKFRESAAETLGQKRIILVGGSSLGWGVSADSLTNSLGVLTLNSGIHAGVGYRNFFRSISDVVDKNNDIFVISPEYSIVSQGSGLGRSNEFCEISIFVREIYTIDCIGHSLRKLSRIALLLRKNSELNLSDHYFSSGFNAFGDYVHRVPGQNMIGKMNGYDKCSDWRIADLQEKYIPFIAELAAEGNEVVYLPNFFPAVACSDSEKIRTFHEILFDKYGIRPFRQAKLLFDEKYFYNTEYHLTAEGVFAKTEIFREQLNHYLHLGV